MFKIAIYLNHTVPILGFSEIIEVLFLHEILIKKITFKKKTVRDRYNTMQ